MGVKKKWGYNQKSEISSHVITNETKGNPFTFSCVKSDKHTNTQTHKQTNTQTDKQTNRQTDKHTNTQTDKQTNTQTDKLLGSIVCRNIGHSSEWQLE